MFASQTAQATRNITHHVGTGRTAAESLAAAFGNAPVPATLAAITVPARPAEPKKARTAPQTTRAPKAAVLHRCRCSELVMETGEWTGCEAMVKGTFAPGHDAKAASLVVRAALEASDDPETGGKVYDEAAQVWRSPLEIFAGTKLGQKVAAKLGQAEAKARQAAATFSHATGASETAPTEATDAEKATKPGRTLMVVQHRRQGAYAGRDTETSEVADLAWEEITHPADRAPALA